MENPVQFKDVLDPKSKTEDLDYEVQIKMLMDKIEKLEAEKQQAREEFGVQRAKMKEMYLQKEEELKRESAEHNRLLSEVKKLTDELGESRSQLLVAGLRMECEQEAERKCQEEIATLQRLVQETVEEASSTRSNFESEINKLRLKNERLEAEVQEFRHHGTSDRGERDSPILAPVVTLSAVTKTFARKVASQLGADASSSSQDNLEDSMRKVNKYAQEDAEVLRSLVVPLEEEIQVLKNKLRSSYQQLKKYQDTKGDSPKSLDEVETLNKDVSPEVANNQNIEGLSPSKAALPNNVGKPEASSSSGSVDVELPQQPHIVVPCSSPNTQVCINSSSVSSPSEQQQSNIVCKPSSENRTSAHEEPKLSDSVMEKEYETDTSTNSSAKPQQACDMCSNYEAQLVKSQQHAQELEKQMAAQERNLARYREDLAKESEFRKEMEEKWNEKKEEHKVQVAELKQKMESAEEALNELRQTYSQTITEVTDQLMRLTEDREKVEKELTRLQKENDNLVGKHSAHSQQLQNEMINLPDKVEDLHELLLKFHEELIAAKVAKETAEEQVETLRCEIQLLRDQVSAEQEGRESMEDNLTTELVTLKKKLGEYQKDLRINNEKQEKMEHYKRVIADLEVQLAESQNSKVNLDNVVADLRSRVASLQQELDNAEAVQQDFVRLSQSLQVQLEKIRDADSQVRWQHDDDVEECPVCKASFTVTRRKQHCRHCGRIFCTNCLSHTVLSGPSQRPSRVCGVCHTLLVKDTAPYFSTLPPHTPD